MQRSPTNVGEVYGQLNQTHNSNAHSSFPPEPPPLFCQLGQTHKSFQEAHHESSVFGSPPAVKNTAGGLFIEIFAGTCRLTKACRKAGLRSLAVDKDPKRAENERVVAVNICDANQFESLVSFVRAERHSLVHVHFAPSCGTATRSNSSPNL